MAAQVQTTLAGEDVFSVPNDEEFDQAEHGFIAAPELQAIADELIAGHERFHFLRVIRPDEDAIGNVTILWRVKGGAPGGRRTLGKTQVATNLLGYFADRAFVIWIAADHARKMQLTHRQVEALVFHQLAYCGFDLKRGHVIVHPDATFFLDEYRLYGPWRDSLERAAEVIKQQPLFAAEKRFAGEQQRYSGGQVIHGKWAPSENEGE